MDASRERRSSASGALSETMSGTKSATPLGRNCTCRGVLICIRVLIGFGFGGGKFTL